MQLLIDTETETSAALIRAATMIMQLAYGRSTDDELEAIEAGATPRRQPATPARPTPPPVGKPATEPAAPAPLPPGNTPPPPVVHPEFHPDAIPQKEGVESDPTALFGVPRAPLAVAGTATVPATSTTTQTLAPADTVAPPPVPAAPNAAASAAVNSSSPATSATGQAPASAAGDRDNAGIRWDARVHSETKKQNADGTWRFRRNLDESVKSQVMAELKASSVASLGPTTVLAGAAPPPPAQMALVVAPPPPPNIMQVPQLQVAPPPPVSLPASDPIQGTASVQLPVSTDVGVQQSAPSGEMRPTTFRELMQKVNGALANGKLTPTQLTEACKAAGVESVTQLAANAALVPVVDANLGRWLNAA